MRTVLRILGALLAAVPLYAAAAEPYFPLLVLEDSWSYRIEQGPKGEPPSISFKSVKVLYRTTGWQYAITSYLPKVASDRQIHDVLLTVDTDACVVDPFIKAVLRVGVRCEVKPAAGEEWNEALQIGDRTLQAKTTFLGTEELIVGAGKFTTLKFTFTGTFLNKKGRRIADVDATYWYAPEVKGMVRIDSHDATSEGEHVFVASLESFPAK